MTPLQIVGGVFGAFYVVLFGWFGYAWYHTSPRHRRKRAMRYFQED